MLAQDLHTEARRIQADLFGGCSTLSECYTVDEIVAEIEGYYNGDVGAYVRSAFEAEVIFWERQGIFDTAFTDAIRTRLTDAGYTLG